MLSGKTIVIGVSGSISAYKAADVVSALKKLNADVHVVMTKPAADIITPLTLETLSQNPVHTDMMKLTPASRVAHIELAKAADVFAVVPCSASTAARLAMGSGENILCLTALPLEDTQRLVAPAMNSRMYANPLVRENIEKLKKFGWRIVEPQGGRLACGDVGYGKLADVNFIVEAICEEALRPQGDLKGRRVLVTAGATCEDIDPVRYITNRSSGKMGFAVARAAKLRGAEVTLVAGAHSAPVPMGVNVINVRSADEMSDAVKRGAGECDMLIMAAAVADFSPYSAADNKIKKGAAESVTLELGKTEDILKSVSEEYGGKIAIAGFCMETEMLIRRAEKKLLDKQLDLIVANDLKTEGAGFAADTNVVCVIDRDLNRTEYPIMDKFAVANVILDRLKAAL